MPGPLKNLLLQIAFGCGVFSCSAWAVADTLGERLFSELLGTQAIKLVNGLPKSTRQLPVDAISEGDFQRLVKELNLLAAEFSTIKQALSTDDTSKITKRLEVLSARIQMLSNPTITGRCAQLSLDPVSAAASEGNWATVKTSQGAAIERGSHEHLKLFFYYKQGCSGQRDFKVARKVLEDISATPYDYKKTKPGLRSDVRHCELARWARYGVGGERSETLAREYEYRFRSEAWMVPINPTAAELRDLVTRHPGYEAASYGFLCPPNRVTGGIDPRNPWKDLE